VLLFLPLIALGVAMLASSGRSQAARAATTTGFAAFPARPALPASPMASPPSPLRVLAQMLAAGMDPPPQVILCAIAEAELLGRLDVAREIVEALIAPVVADAIRHGQPPAQGPDPGYDDPPPTWPDGSPSAYQPVRYYGIPAQTQPGSPLPGWGSHGGPDPAQASAPQMPVASVASPQSATPAAQPAVRDHRGTITVSGRSCPIEGVRAQDWEAFANRVAREMPTFTSKRHVGAFRQSVDRLAELGIDPAQVASSPEEQVRAFCTDMDDAYRHARDSGMVAEFQGALVDVPTPEGGTSIPIEVTLSGVLGVIQAAGLEGAASWLSDPNDRRKFANTTRAFVRTNGVF